MILNFLLSAVLTHFQLSHRHLTWVKGNSFKLDYLSNLVYLKLVFLRELLKLNCFMRHVLAAVSDLEIMSQRLYIKTRFSKLESKYLEA